MSSEIKLLLRSLSITLLISLLIGIGVGFVISWRVGVGFAILTTVAQLGIGYILGAAREKLQMNTMDRKIAEALINAKNHRTPIAISCAYCNFTNTVPLSLTLTNTFKCNSCNQPNKVFIQLSPTRITQPVSPLVNTNEIAMDEGPNLVRSTINDPVQITR